MPKEFTPFSGRGQRLRSPKTQAEPVPCEDEVPATQPLIDVDNEMECSQGTIDPAGIETEVIDQIKTDFDDDMQNHHDWIGSLLSVANTWVQELPHNKYTKDTHINVNQFQQRAGQFRLDCRDMQTVELPVDAYEDARGALRKLRSELAFAYKSCQAEVDFLMGRASKEVRKLKREGSDVTCEEPPAKSTRTSPSSADH
jgi:hypothetical protein